MGCITEVRDWSVGKVLLVRYAGAAMGCITNFGNTLSIEESKRQTSLSHPYEPPSRNLLGVSIRSLVCLQSF